MLYAVKRSESGLGLFATGKIVKGTRIVEYSGQLLDQAQADQRGGKYLLSLDQEWCIDGSPRSNLGRYVNHSCRPNAEALVSRRQVWIWSTRSIRSGTEITMDYGKQYFDEIIRPLGCKCDRCGQIRDKASEGNRALRKAALVG